MDDKVAGFLAGAFLARGSVTLYLDNQQKRWRAALSIDTRAPSEVLDQYMGLPNVLAGYAVKPFRYTVTSATQIAPIVQGVLGAYPHHERRYELRLMQEFCLQTEDTGREKVATRLRTFKATGKEA